VSRIGHNCNAVTFVNKNKPNAPQECTIRPFSFYLYISPSKITRSLQPAPADNEFNWISTLTFIDCFASGDGRVRCGHFLARICIRTNDRGARLVRPLPRGNESSPPTACVNPFLVQLKRRSHSRDGFTSSGLDI
jgi:hypothetical protein